MNAQVIEFLGRLADDAALEADIRAARANADPADAVCEVGRKHGIDFSPSDVEEVLDVLRRGDASEIPDELLAKVAGGAQEPEGFWNKLQQAVFRLLGGGEVDHGDSEANAVAGVR